MLDSSCFLAWLLPDEYIPSAETLLTQVQNGAVAGLVPGLFYQEVGNTLVQCARKGRITPIDFDSYLTCLLQMSFEVNVYPNSPLGLVESVRLAQTYRLTVYDAGYLALALHENVPLATQDAALSAAADRLGLLWKA